MWPATYHQHHSPIDDWYTKMSDYGAKAQRLWMHSFKGSGAKTKPQPKSCKQYMQNDGFVSTTAGQKSENNVRENKAARDSKVSSKVSHTLLPKPLYN